MWWVKDSEKVPAGGREPGVEALEAVSRREGQWAALKPRLWKGCGDVGI